MPEISLFLPTTPSTIWISRRAIFLDIKTKLVENLQMFSFFYSKSEKSWIKYQIQTQSETKWQEEVPFRKKIVFFQVKISCHILIWHENQPLVLIIVMKPITLFKFEALVSNFWVKRFIHVKIFLTIWRELSNTINSAILDF